MFTAALIFTGKMSLCNHHLCIKRTFFVSKFLFWLLHLSPFCQFDCICVWPVCHSQLCCNDDLLPGHRAEVQRTATNARRRSHRLRWQQRCVFNSLGHLTFISFALAWMFCISNSLSGIFSDGIQWRKASCSLGCQSQVSCRCVLTFLHLLPLKD